MGDDLLLDGILHGFLMFVICVREDLGGFWWGRDYFRSHRVLYGRDHGMHYWCSTRHCLFALIELLLLLLVIPIAFPLVEWRSLLPYTLGIRMPSGVKNVLLSTRGLRKLVSETIATRCSCRQNDQAGVVR